MKSTLCTIGKMALTACLASILATVLLRKAIRRGKSSCPICQLKHQIKRRIQSS